MFAVRWLVARRAWERWGLRRLSRQAAILIWLGVLDFAGLITDYELAAVQNLFGWHTISHWANVYQWLGWFILAAMLSVCGWWFMHFRHSHPQ